MDRSFRKRCMIVLCFFVQLYAGNDEELFLSGNKLYEQGQYDKALASYDAITKKGRAVLYNMGNCYYHKGDCAQACVYWARAQQGATGQEIKQIAQCRQHIMQKCSKPYETSLVERLHYYVRTMVPYASLFFMQIFFLLLWCLFVCFVYHKGRSYKLITGLFFICILVVSTILFVRVIKQCTPCGVITKDKTALFVGPNDSFHTNGLLSVPDHVEIQEEREGWYKVRYCDTIGWIKAESVQRI